MSRDCERTKMNVRILNTLVAIARESESDGWRNGRPYVVSKPRTQTPIQYSTER